MWDDGFGDSCGSYDAPVAVVKRRMTQDHSVVEVVARETRALKVEEVGNGCC
jgi:hypothetical protein